MAELKKKQYIPLLCTAYIIVAIFTLIKGNLLLSEDAFYTFLGGGIGLALFPLIAMRFHSNTAGWFVLALFTSGVLINYEKQNNISAILSKSTMHTIV